MQTIREIGQEWIALSSDDDQRLERELVVAVMLALGKGDEVEAVRRFRQVVLVSMDGHFGEV